MILGTTAAIVAARWFPAGLCPVEAPIAGTGWRWQHRTPAVVVVVIGRRAGPGGGKLAPVITDMRSRASDPCGKPSVA